MRAPDHTQIPRTDSFLAWKNYYNFYILCVKQFSFETGMTEHGAAGAAKTLFFTAGIKDENDGLLGTFVPAPGESDGSIE